MGARGVAATDVVEAVLFLFGVLAAAGSLLGSLALVRNARHWRRLVDRRLAEPAPAHTPPAALIIPARGDPAALEENLRGLLAQDYPELATVVVVDSRSEPLFAKLEELVADARGGRASVVAVEDLPAPPAPSGKCAALLRGIQEVPEGAQVLVFADDDVRPPADWVRRLVGPLADPGVSVATAYRWYFSDGAGLSSHTRAAWNVVGLAIMFQDKYNFAWGGGMAVRREDFEAWEVAKGWERAISDDYVVTISAKRDGRPISFVPGALVPSHETVNFKGLLEWCRRQSFMTKIYDPKLWRFAVVPYVLFNATMLLGAGLLAAWAAGVALPLWSVVVSAVFVSHFPLNVAKNAIFYGGVSRMLPAQRDRLARLRGAYLRGSMLSPFVMIYALWKTRDLRLIEWRGKRYEVHGPMDVRPL